MKRFSDIRVINDAQFDFASGHTDVITHIIIGISATVAIAQEIGATGCMQDVSKSTLLSERLKPSPFSPPI